MLVLPGAEPVVLAFSSRPEVLAYAKLGSASISGERRTLALKELGEFGKALEG